MAKQGYRSPWGDDREMRQFRSETESAMSDGPDRFRLNAGPAALSRQTATQRGLLAASVPAGPEQCRPRPSDMDEQQEAALIAADGRVLRCRLV